MIEEAIRAEMRRLVLGEKWRIGTVARRFGVHVSVVLRAVFDAGDPKRRAAKGLLDPYRAYVIERLEKYPELTVTRLLSKLRERGFNRGVTAVRRYIVHLRGPRSRKPARGRQGGIRSVSRYAQGRSQQGLEAILLFRSMLDGGLGPKEVPVRLTPKRLKSDSGIDEMYPYYAGFSSRFAAATLRDLNLPPGALVLDPWNGSGTTTMAASMLGLSAVGVDLNPFACAVAAAKLAPRHHERQVLRLAPELAERATSLAMESGSDEEPLAEWLPWGAAVYARALVGVIRARTRHAPPLRALLLVALARALRPYAITRTKNPTWPVPSLLRVNVRVIPSSFVGQAAAVASLLQEDTRARVRIAVADARTLPVASGTVRAMLTSPPYFTRIDYAAKTGFELALLGHRSAGMLRQRLMGTTALRTPRPDSIPGHWPSAVRTVLRSIRRHPSHRSAGYYFPNAVQYFGDAIASMAEIHRVLSPDGTALLVLQDSYYKELHIDLPALFLSIARTLGFRTTVVRADPVRLVMTSINTASRKYLPKRSYVESVIRITKGAS
jgi:SAM-dependent methyltransferase